MKSIYLRECENAWYNFWVWLDWTQATPIVLDPLSILIWSRNYPKVAELCLRSEIWSEIWYWWRIISRTCSKNEQSWSYDYFIFFKNMELFWPEIECYLIIWASITLKSYILLDIFRKKLLLWTHRAQQLVLNQEFLGVIKLVTFYQNFNADQ